MPDAPLPWQQRLAAFSSLVSLPSAAPRAVAAAVAAAGLVVAVAVAVITMRGAPPAPEVSLPRAGTPGAPGGPAPAEPEPPAYVHVAGAVARPGVYRVHPGGRVADVVEAAGGPGPDADLDRLNLAARVADGERVYVPRRGEVPPGDATLGAGGTGAAPGAGGGGAAGTKLDLNTATLEQLEDLPGVGPATAKAILEYRRQHGRFSQVQELLEVRGIGEAKLAALRSRVRV